jgi:hypothetical protein
MVGSGEIIQLVSQILLRQPDSLAQRDQYGVGYAGFVG